MAKQSYAELFITTENEIVSPWRRFVETILALTEILEMTNRLMNKKYFYGLLALVISTLACEPMFAIGWEELLILFILLTILLGPPLYRLIRRLEKLLKSEKKNK